MTKPDHRGLHWKEKVAEGKGPTCASHTTLWAECATRVEAELNELLHKTGRTSYVLPWRRHGVHCSSGNSIKALYMQLLIHHMNRVVEIEFCDRAMQRDSDQEAEKNFMGIEKVAILQPEVFNNVNKDLYGTIRTISWADENLALTQRKTMKKLWNTAGLGRENRHDRDKVYIFQPRLIQRHLDYKAQLNQMRSQKRQRESVESPLNPAASISFLLCSDKDILRHRRELRVRAEELVYKAAQLRAEASYLDATATELLAEAANV